MPKLRVHNVTVSLDGFAAGTDQRMDAPFGDGIDDGLHDWMFAAMKDHADGRQGADVDFVARSEDNIGATIMGRNMFGPYRGPWENEAWTGWWGDNPPFHHPVFVHTHHTRPSVSMKGGTDFHFTDEPIETVLARACEAADGKDVRIGGGPATIQQYLRATSSTNCTSPSRRSSSAGASACSTTSGTASTATRSWNSSAPRRSRTHVWSAAPGAAKDVATSDGHLRAT